MSWIHTWLEYLRENKYIVLIVVVTVILVAFLLGYFTRNVGLYVACLFLAFGGIRLFTDFFENGKKTDARWLPCWCFLGGAGYVLLVAMLRFRESIRKRKKQRQEISRRLQFALPDKENAYVRARLDTALQAEALDGKELFSADKKSVGVRLGYARRMAQKIQEAPLSPVERLDVEEWFGLLGLYSKKEKWSNGDLRTVNELCSKLLKLSAKYGVVIP